MTVDFIDGGIPRLNLYASFIGQIKHFLKACTNRFVAIGLSEVSEKGNFSAIDMAIPSQKSGYYTVQVKADDVDYCSLRLCAEAIYGADSKDIEDALLDPDGYGIGDESLYSPNIVVVNAVADNLTDATCEKFILNTAKDAFEPYRTEYFIIAVNSNTKKDIKNVRMFYVNGETGLIFKDVDYSIIYPSPDTKERVQNELKNIESLTYNPKNYDDDYYTQKNKGYNYNNGYNNNYNGNYYSSSYIKDDKKEKYVDAKINIDNPSLESLT